MPSPHTVWLNGEILPADEARLSIDDAAITSAVTVTERLRTFKHEVFLLEPHLDRLFESAQAASIEPPQSKSALNDLIREIVRRNAKHVADEDDLTVSVWISAGISGRATLCIGASPIPAARYADAYSTGLRLVVPPTRAIDPETLPPAIKTRNRLHWHIADRQAEAIEPGAAALLVDRQGFVTETATANVFAVREGQLFTTRRKRTLAGISQRYLFELADRLDIQLFETDLMIEDFLHADEVLCTGSVACLQPAVRINQRTIGTGVPGPVFKRLLNAWANEVGVDIAGQMSRVGGAHHE